MDSDRHKTSNWTSCQWMMEEASREHMRGSQPFTQSDLHACIAAPSSSSYTVQRVVCHRSITTSIPTSVKWSAFRKLRLFTVVFCRLLLLSKFLLFDAAQNESLCNNFWWLNSSSADHLLPVHHIAFYSCSAAVGRYLSDQWCWWCLHHGGGVSAARGFSYLNNNWHTCEDVFADDFAGISEKSSAKTETCCASLIRSVQYQMFWDMNATV